MLEVIGVEPVTRCGRRIESVWMGRAYKCVCEERLAVFVPFEVRSGKGLFSSALRMCNDSKL